MQQLLLFRDVKPEDIDAFGLADKAKKEAQAFLQKKYGATFPEKKHDHLPILLFNTIITQVRDELSREPDTIRIFIRKIISNSKIKGTTTTFTSKEKVIPKWANMLYVENPLSMEFFLEICRNIYSLEYAGEVLADKKNIELLKQTIKEKPLIIKFDHKIFCNYSSYSNSIHLNMAFKRINNAFDKVKNIAKENNWILLGSFDDFNRESSLLKDLDRSSSLSSEDYEKLFSTDYLLLNNAEFTTQKHNTFGWPLIILPPQTYSKSSPTIRDSTYFYIKETLTSKLIRFELFLDSCDFKLLSGVAAQAQESVLK